MTAIHEYIQSLDKELAAGNTTEHTHRPALKALFQTLIPRLPPPMSPSILPLSVRRIFV